MKHYQDYRWKNGKPIGINPTHSLDCISYKVVADPYYKRISIEKYQNDLFIKLIYDSAFFDFRHLKPVDQYAWEKTTISENDNESICHIRNQDDRLILIERYLFEDGICRQCETKSPEGTRLSIQRICYQKLGDPFNGVILYDSNDHIIMYKKYQINPLNNTFEELIEECLDTTFTSHYLQLFEVINENPRF